MSPAHLVLGAVHRFRFGLLAIILLVAAGLRVNHLDSQGLWFDEFCSLSAANGWGLQICVSPGWGVVPDEPRYARWSDARPLRCVIPAMAATDDHPPLYFLLLRGWEAIFGDSDRSVRMPSVIASLAAIVLLYAVARERHDSATALAACAIMAVAGPQIEFAQQARHYMLLMLLSLAMIWALLRLQRLGAGAWRFIALLLATLAALLTHYLAVAVVAAMLVYVLLDMRNRAGVAAVGAIAGAGVIFGIVWGPMLLRQLPTLSAGHDWMIDNHPHRLWRLGQAFVELPVRFLIEPDFSADSRRLLLGGGLLWLAVPWALARPQTRLAALWLAVPVAVVVASDLLQHTGQLSLIRFTLASTPAAYLLLAGMGRGRWRWIAPGAAVLLAVTNLAQAYDPPWKNDLRPAALALDRQLGPDDALVFVSANGNARALAQWLHEYEHFLLHSPRAIALLHERADANTLARLATCRRVWVAWPMQDRTVDAVLPGFEMLRARPLPPAMELYEGRITAAAKRR